MNGLLRDAGIVAGSVTAIVGCTVLVARLRPVRWVWRTLVAHPLATWFRAQVAHEVEPRTAALDERIKAVEYELRPNNGKSFRDAVCSRLEALEQSLPPAKGA